MELNRYFKPFLKWWWLLAASVLLAGISSYLMVSRQPPIFQAKVTLMIGRAVQNPNPTANELSLSQQLARTYADIAYRQPIQEQVMEALGLNWLPEYVSRPIPNSQLLEVVVIDTSPPRAQAVANEIANQLILQSPTAPKPEEQERENFINDQLNGLQVKIKETEEQILEKEVALENAFSAGEIANLEGELATLQGKLTTLQANYAGLLSNTREGAVNTLSLTESARMPTEPIGPALPRAVVTASTIALILAAITASLLEYLDDMIRTPEDIQRTTNVVSLPSIPKIQNKNENQSIVALDEPRSPVVNAFRALRTAIYARDNVSSPNVLLITSTVPGEGKSLFAANLAVVLAQDGHNVTLVDADLRLPDQHRLFEIQKSPGLSELLSNKSLVRLTQQSKKLTLTRLLKSHLEMLQEISRPGVELTLSILPSGSARSGAPGLLSSVLMKRVLAFLSDQSDYVIIDSPPMMAASDALVFSTEVDGVVLVARAGKTRRKEFRQIIDQLRDVNANVIGVALNGLEAASGSYQYRYYDYYQKSSTSSETLGGDEQQSRQGSTNSTHLSKIHNNYVELIESKLRSILN